MAKNKVDAIKHYMFEGEEEIKYGRDKRSAFAPRTWQKTNLGYGAFDKVQSGFYWGVVEDKHVFISLNEKGELCTYSSPITEYGKCLMMFHSGGEDEPSRGYADVSAEDLSLPVSEKRFLKSKLLELTRADELKTKREGRMFWNALRKQMEAGKEVLVVYAVTN